MARLTVAALFAAAFGLVAIVLLYEDHQSGEGVVLFAAELIAFYAVGGAIAGLLSAPLFGHGGLSGWVRAIVGGLVVTVLGGMLGGALAATPTMVMNQSLLPLAMGLALGTVSLPLAAPQAPLTVPLWLGVIIAAHVIARAARRRGTLSS
ncbi:MAG: hypothetical protein AAGJ94_14025 [Pseudomonadota bacterium]